MGIRITQDTVGRLAELPMGNRQMMREVGELARERILRRTARGVDANGVPFRKYSQRYALVKSRVTGNTGVNLSLSGEMLRALKVVEVTEKTVLLGFDR